MLKNISAIILKTDFLQATLEFYRQLGIDLHEEQHELGPLHFAGKIGQQHFAIYELDPWTKEERRVQSHNTMIGFEVSSIAETLKNLQALKTKVLINPETVSWGRRCVVVDPDGRPIELSEGK